ncbi:MAG: hypothetical protein ACPGJS_04375 [Flammeovirgaceae bacterium]
MRNLIITCLLLCLVGSTYAQKKRKKEKTTQAPTYRNEWLYGLNFNTNGGLLGGFMFKYGRTLKDRHFHGFSIEMVNVKHPKERRFPIPATGASFIPGKSNFLYIVRPLYNREYTLFKKAREQGVQVNAMLAAGPSFGIVAPYLVEINQRQIVQYDPEIHNPNDVTGLGSFAEGIGQSNIQIGGALKGSLFFELGTGNRNVTGFEVGFTLDAYQNEVEILPLSKNRNVYTAGFVTFFYGIRK